jgi:hypothetical protein
MKRRTDSAINLTPFKISYVQSRMTNCRALKIYSLGKNACTDVDILIFH